MNSRRSELMANGNGRNNIQRLQRLAASSPLNVECFCVVVQCRQPIRQMMVEKWELGERNGNGASFTTDDRLLFDRMKERWKMWDIVDARDDNKTEGMHLHMYMSKKVFRVWISFLDKKRESEI